MKLSLVTGGPGTSESTVSLVLLGFKELKMMVPFWGRSNSPKNTNMEDYTPMIT